MDKKLILSIAKLVEDADFKYFDNTVIGIYSKKDMELVSPWSVYIAEQIYKKYLTNTKK